MERPRLKAHFSAEVVDDSKVFLVAENEHYLVQGAGAVRVLPYLDGSRTIAQIAQELSGELPPGATFSAVRRYAAYDVLADGPSSLADGERAFWDALGLDSSVGPISAGGTVSAGGTAAATGARFAAGTTTVPGGDAVQDRGTGARPSVSVLAVGKADAVPVMRALVDSGIDVTGPADSTGQPAGPDVTVVVTDDYLNPALSAVSRAFLHSGRSWLLAKPTGLTLWLGPLLSPGRTGCWHCLSQRLAGNQQVEDYLRGKRNGAGSSTGAGSSAGGAAKAEPTRAPHSELIFSGMLAGEVKKIAGGQPSVLEGTLISVDLRTLETAPHTLVRQPQCPECGDPSLVTKRPPRVVLTPSASGHPSEGGFRTQLPGQTFARLAHHVSPYLGAVSSLRSLASYDNGVTYTYGAGHNFAMYADNMDQLRRNLRGQSGGKGRSDVQARVSAICEAIERYCGVWRGDETVTRAAYDQLDPECAVHPDELLLFSPAQVAARDEWNLDPAHRLHRVPQRFDVTRSVDWSTAWSLTYDRERKVPAGYAWYGHPDVAGQPYCYSDSNGNASGNTLEEAILQGFLEVVERDAVALWWYNRIPRAGLDPDSLDDPYVSALTEHYRRMGRSLGLLDITSDLGIPVMVAVSHRVGHPVEDVLVGFGAHLDPKIAAIRALTEVSQFLPTVEARDADGMTAYQTDEPATLEWLRETKIADEAWLRPAPGRPLSTAADYAVPPAADLASVVGTCVDRAAQAGLEVIVLNQTRPDIELNVVKVMVPGTRHFWRRLGAGRLYDVPVRMGWLDRPLTEDEMNPRSVFF
jgi:bacteriocin biosynthesis cyclodehydratase domain-containing protein